MIDLNFLTRDDKDRLEREFRLLRLRSYAFALLGLSAFLAASLWLNIWLLREHASSLETSIVEIEATQARTETTTLESQIKEFNARVKMIGDIERVRFPLSVRLVDLLNAVPTGVALEQLAADLGDTSLILRGTARDRSSYLGLKDALLGTGFFTNVELPITDLLSRESIRFTIRSSFSEKFLEPLTPT